MHVDEYHFGSITVDGRAYGKDLILLPEGVRANWWRDEGHSLSVGDLEDVFDAEPDILVIGTGAHGVMDVPEATRRAVREAGIELVVERTTKAVRRYNELASDGQRVAAGFHLTC
jgi:hypothetical protein